MTVPSGLGQKQNLSPRMRPRVGFDFFGCPRLGCPKVGLGFEPLSETRPVIITSFADF